MADTLIDSKNQLSSLVACDQTCLCRNAFYSLDLVFLIISTRKHVSCCHWIRRSHLSGSKGSFTELTSHHLDEQQQKQNISVLIQGSYPHNEKLNLVWPFSQHTMDLCSNLNLFSDTFLTFPSYFTVTCSLRVEMIFETYRWEGGGACHYSPPTPLASSASPNVLFSWK